MARRVAYQGAKFSIEFALDSGGRCPGGEFFDDLDMKDKAKLMALFRLACEHGDFHNKEKFGDLSDGLFEFKSFQVRMPFAYAKNERGVILITHGFIKKKNKAPKEEIERARRILNQDQDRPKIGIIKKEK